MAADLTVLDPAEPHDAEALQMARAIIGAHHAHLANANIVWVWKTTGDPEKPWKSKGRVISGQAKKASPMESALRSEPVDFIITLNWDIWLQLPIEKRRALIDHELCHCAAEMDENSDVTYSTRPHDVEEFQAILERHGAWTIDLEQFAGAAKQLDLFADCTLVTPDGTETRVRDMAAYREARGTH